MCISEGRKGVEAKYFWTLTCNEEPIKFTLFLRRKGALAP